MSSWSDNSVSLTRGLTTEVASFVRITSNKEEESLVTRVAWLIICSILNDSNIVKSYCAAGDSASMRFKFISPQDAIFS